MTRLEQLAYSMIHDCVDAIIAKTINGAVISWNTAAEQIFGYNEHEMLGHSVMVLVPQDKQAEELELLARLNRGERIQDLATVRLHKNGARLPVVLTISPIYDSENNVIGASKIVRLATEMDTEQQQLKSLAYHDSLTGLANRALLIDRLGQAMRRDERSGCYGAIFFIDLDNFKMVNDTAGHLAGDKVLIACARRMKKELRECDTVARWGGDEFIVMIEDLDQDLPRALENVRKLALKLLNVLRKPYDLGDITFGCPPSIGVSLFRGVYEPIETVIENADRAMYRAKLAGKNSVHIDEQAPHDSVTAMSSTSKVAVA